MISILKKLVYTVVATLVAIVLAVAGVITATLAWPLNVAENQLLNIVVYRATLTAIWTKKESKDV